jgi:hypothetical protein
MLKWKRELLPLVKNNAPNEVILIFYDMMCTVQVLKNLGFNRIDTRKINHLFQTTGSSGTIHLFNGLCRSVDGFQRIALTIFGAYRSWFTI